MVLEKLRLQFGTEAKLKILHEEPVPEGAVEEVEVEAKNNGVDLNGS